MPLLWLSIAFLCGILLSASISIPIAGWILLALIVVILLLPPVYRRLFLHLPERITQLTAQLNLNKPTILPVMILAVSLGAIRYQVAQPTITPETIAYYNNQATEYQVEGVLVEPPDVRDSYTNLRLRVEQIRTVDEYQFTPVHGLLLARVHQNASWQYGDRIRLQGHLETPPEDEDFSYRDYLARQGVYSYMPIASAGLLQHGQGNPLLTIIYKFQQQALGVVYRLFPDPEASLMAGILLGVQAGIPQEVQEAFRLTGTSHIIVISGFNITIIAAMFSLLFSHLLGERRGALVAAIGIGFYTLLVGANPAVVRAAILGLLTLLGHQVGRQQSGLNSLAFVAALMALFTPSVLWDVSFQLSFAATLGIMLYAEPFTQGFINFAARFISAEKAERLAGPVGEYFILTLAAQLTALPFLLYYFQRLSLTSLIANPLILPAQPPLMILGGMAVLSGLVFQPLGQLFAWAAWPFTAFTIRVVEWLASIPHGSIPLGQVAVPLILLFYVVLFGLTFARSRFSNLAARITPIIPLTAMAVLIVMVWRAGSFAPDGLLHVTILDVGTGEAIYIQSPSGRSILINGGSSATRLSDALGRRMAPFNRQLDWLVVADIDNEDLSGLTRNLERFTPSNVLWAGNTYGTRSASELWAALYAASIPITRMQAGHSLDLGAGASLQALSTAPRGADLLLEWDDFRLVLPLGMDLEALEDLQSASTMRSLTAVLLAESGYAPLNPPELLANLEPQLVLLSVAAGDRDGLPSPETLEALQGYTLLRTDQNGWIELVTDGRQMWVEVER